MAGAAKGRPSVADALREATALLTEAGVPSPRPDALALLAHVWGVAHVTVRTAAARGDILPETVDLPAFSSVLARRSAREPLQHITGRAAFRGIELEVGPGVFVPRPETESVAGAAIDAAHALGLTAPIIVDLCSGSGAIALAVAIELPDATVCAVELSTDALVYLRRNVAALPEDVRQRIDVTQGDARTALGNLDGAVDIVVSNPPYIPPGATPRDPEVALYDPELALYGLGADGLEVPRGIASAAHRLLKPGGVFVMEHGDEQGAAVRGLLADHTVWADVSTGIDLTGRDRFVVASRL